jgi:hypothetical protein
MLQLSIDRKAGARPFTGAQEPRPPARRCVDNASVSDWSYVMPMLFWLPAICWFGTCRALADQWLDLR